MSAAMHLPSQSQAPHGCGRYLPAARARSIPADHTPRRRVCWPSFHRTGLRLGRYIGAAAGMHPPFCARVGCWLESGATQNIVQTWAMEVHVSKTFHGFQLRVRGQSHPAWSIIGGPELRALPGAVRGHAPRAHACHQVGLHCPESADHGVDRWCQAHQQAGAERNVLLEAFCRRRHGRWWNRLLLVCTLEWIDDV
eukprot:scaffold25174_cov19-Tisochrysis_lutea.AAC.5